MFALLYFPLTTYTCPSPINISYFTYVEIYRAHPCESVAAIYKNRIRVKIKFMKLKKKNRLE